MYITNNKLCILLTRNAKSIPFDLKNKPHIVFSSLDVLEKKLRKDLVSLQIEAELCFDETDKECIATVPVYMNMTASIPTSQATSIRAKVTTGSEVHRRNVSARMVKLERRVGRKPWKRFSLEQPIQLTWTDGNISTDFHSSESKYVNVFHIDHRDNKLTFWVVPMPASLSEFLSQKATYRVAIAVLGKQIKLDIVWRGQWNTIMVARTKRKA